MSQDTNDQFSEDSVIVVAAKVVGTNDHDEEEAASRPDPPDHNPNQVKSNYYDSCIDEELILYCPSSPSQRADFSATVESSCYDIVVEPGPARPAPPPGCFPLHPEEQGTDGSAGLIDDSSRCVQFRQKNCKLIEQCLGFMTRMMRPKTNGDGQIENTNGDENETEIGLEKDTYTLLLFSRSYWSASFWLGLFICFQQLVLLCSILEQLSEKGVPPITISSTVKFCQFNAILLSLFTQHDLLITIILFFAFLNQENWTKIERSLQDGKKYDNEDEDETNIEAQNSSSKDGNKQERFFWKESFWWKKIFLSYFLRFVVVLLTLITFILVIMKSTNIIDLAKDFTVLFIIAELDKYAYMAISNGYFKNKFCEEIRDANEFKIKV